MIKALIVEDELLARQRLKKLLLPYAHQLEIIGEATNGEEGLKMIESLRPDFIFLDIQMPILNGFEMLLKLTFKPYIIFTTAYDEYAIKAFEENSIDYLLKPIRSERLEITMDKIAKLETKTDSQLFDQNSIDTLIQHLQPSKKIRSITVSLGDKITIVSLDDIVFFQAEDKLTTIYTKGQKKHLITQSLSQLEKKLPDYFMRLNRSSIINDREILEIRKGFNGKLVFEMKHTDKTKITTGSSYTSLVKERLKF
jgi:two-component system LytT family response regulator